MNNLQKKSTLLSWRSSIRATVKCLTYLVACTTISNLAIAHSGIETVQHVFSNFIVQVVNSEQTIIGIVECTTNEVRSCTVLTTTGDRYLDQSELNWLLKYGGPH